MKIAKRLRKNFLFVLASVLVLTAFTVKTSYSAFFTIKSPNNIETVSSGTLSMTVSGAGYASGNVSLTTGTLPTATESATTNLGTPATVTITNTGSVPVDFTLYVTVNNANTVPTNYIYTGLKNGSSWLTLYGTSSYNARLADLTNYAGETSKILYQGTLGASGSGSNAVTYSVYIWLPESSTGYDAAGKTLNVTAGVKSVPQVGQN